MTERILLLNMEQILFIYRAGIRRGSEEEACYQAGCKPLGKELDELINALYDIGNTGHPADRPIPHDEIASWFKEKKQ